MDLAEERNSLVYAITGPEANDKFINKVSIRYHYGGMDSIEVFYNQLNDLANQCPYQGGAAVYSARSFIELFNDSIEFDDEYLCSPQSNNRVSASNTLSQKIKIIPNPANEQIKVTFDGYEGICNISILDAYNQTILTENLNCKDKTMLINVKKLQSGIYFVKTETTSKQILINKVAIIK